MKTEREGGNETKFLRDFYSFQFVVVVCVELSLVSIC